MMKIYRVGVIGCGKMGLNHVHAIAGMPNADLIGLSDLDPERLALACEEVGFDASRCYLNFEDLLSEQPDIVVVATQTPDHAHITIAAAEKGCHVLCEKPLALNLLEADAMVSACTSAGVRLAVNHLSRMTTASIMARDLICAGEIGEILAVDIHDKGGRPIGNTLMEMATHYFDEARFLLSHRILADGRHADELEWVYAHLTTGQGVNAHPSTPEEIVHSQVEKPSDRDCGLVLGERRTVILGFANEVQAVARFHNLPQANSDYAGVDVIGTEGSLAVRGTFFKRLYRRRGHTFAEHDVWQSIPVPSSEEYYSLSNRDAGRWLCQRMVHDLIMAIEDGREAVSSGRDGLIALESLMSIYISHRLGRPIKLPLEERRHPLEVWQADV